MAFWKRWFGAGRSGPEDATEMAPDEEAAVARRALAAGDLPHAALHAGRAVVGPPHSAEHVALLDEVLQAAPDPLALVPKDLEAYVSSILVRARALLLRNRLEDATVLLLNVLAHDPGAPFLSWALERLEREPERASQIDPARVASLVAGLLDRFQPPAFGSLSALLAAMERAHPRSVPLLQIAVAMHTRAGRHEAAIRSAQAAFEVEPSWDTATAVGRAMRFAGRIDEAERAYQEAHRRDPTDFTVWLDCGDMMLEAGRLDASRAHYERVLAAEPDHPWATAGRDLLSELAKAGDVQPRLEALASEATDEDRARALRQLAGLAELTGYLPSPPDLVLRGVERAWSQLQPGSTLQMKLDFPEAASVSLALRSIQERKGAKCVVIVNGAPNPDPREPRTPGEVTLWRFVDGHASPALPAPGAAIAEPIAALAATPFSQEAWWKRARELGSAVGPGGAAELLGVMVHPPRAPEGWFEGRWIFGVQLAAAFALAHVDQRWEGSERRRLLLGLLRGPMDWTVGTAALALARIAGELPAARLEIERELHLLARHAAPFKFCSYAPALRAAARSLPVRSPELEAAAEALES